MDKSFEVGDIVIGDAEKVEILKLDEELAYAAVVSLDQNNLYWFPISSLKPILSTYRLGNKEVPFPVNKAPPLNSVYQIPSLTNDTGFEVNLWSGYPYNMKHLNRGLVYLNAEDAKQVSEALLQLLGEEHD